MSKKNNVNPDYYKIAGRDRPSENVLSEVARRQLRQKKKVQTERRAGRIAERSSPAGNPRARGREKEKSR